MPSSWESPPFWSLHTHSRYSFNDAMPHVEQIVAEASLLGYPALGLSDHGNISGIVTLYKECRKAGIEPLPACELYVTDDSELGRRSNDHLIVAAYTETGYRNLCGLTTLAHRKYYYKPRVDLADFAALAEDGKLEGIALSTGCYFGTVVQRLLTRGPKAAKKLVDYYATLFPRIYVEIQNHGIDHSKDEHPQPGYDTDDELNAALADIADELGLPMVVTQDSHYVRRAEQPLHDLFKQIIGWGDDPDDAIFPGDGYHMVGNDWLVNYFEPKLLDRGLEGLTDLAAAAKVRIPELDTFQLKVPDVTVSGDAQKELEERFWEEMRNWRPDGKTPADEIPAYYDRGMAELEVISFAEMAGLILVVVMTTDFMQERDIWYAARGSASGSLVNRALRITQLDPVARGNDFTRFLSKDRTKPPDIDLDVEHTRRGEVEAFLDDTFAIVKVGTLGTYSLWGEEEGDDSTRGSLRTRYYSVRNKKGLAKLNWTEIPESERSALEALSARELLSGYGRHPAGYVVAQDERVLSLLPLSYIASSKSMISAFPKKEVEQLGFVKLDLLGLKDRTALRVAAKAADIPCVPSGIAPGAIPDDDPATYKRICEGKTEGVFQLQGWSATNGVKRMRPKNIDDLSAAMALFRPATQLSGATSDYLARRKKKMAIPPRHPDIMDVTKTTYGVLLYQEQMVEVLRRMKMPPDELTEMLDAVKASNKYSIGAKATIEAMLPKIRAYASASNWNDDDISWLVDALIAFADYSFNKSHADQYADNAYVSAYLAEHHPEAFWLGQLTAYINEDKEKDLIRAARRYSIRIRPAHVNHSDVLPKLDPAGGIRRGLLSVKGVGWVVATEIAKTRPPSGYASMQDFAKNVNSSKVSGAKKLVLGENPIDCGGIVTALYDSSAFEGIPDR